MAEIRRSPDEVLVVFPLIYRVSPPSQVVQDFSHQQYESIMEVEPRVFFLETIVSWRRSFHLFGAIFSTFHHDYGRIIFVCMWLRVCNESSL